MLQKKILALSLYISSHPIESTRISLIHYFIWAEVRISYLKGGIQEDCRQNCLQSPALHTWFHFQRRYFGSYHTRITFVNNRVNSGWSVCYWVFKLQAPGILYIGQAYYHCPANPFYLFSQHIYFMFFYTFSHNLRLFLQKTSRVA